MHGHEVVNRRRSNSGALRRVHSVTEIVGVETADVIIARMCT